MNEITQIGPDRVNAMELVQHPQKIGDRWLPRIFKGEDDHWVQVGSIGDDIKVRRALVEDYSPQLANAC